MAVITDLPCVNNIKLAPEFKATWLAALRGGAYPQGNRFLCSRPVGGSEWNYCCVGVALKLTKADLFEAPDKRVYSDIKDGKATDEIREVAPWDSHDGMLMPENASEIEDWFGALNLVNDDDSQADAVIELLDQLAGFNDGGSPAPPPHTFAEIADWIELHL